MPVTTFVNQRSVVHKASGGWSLAALDACNTPGAGPVPYVNLALSKDAARCASTVRSDGEPIMKGSSVFAASMGDEPGSLGGLVSGVVKGAAKFTNMSFDVLVEGEGTPRALDPMMQNMAAAGFGPLNTSSPAEQQPSLGSGDPMKDLLCEIMCLCNVPGLKTACARRLLASRKGRCWDPRIPGVYVEASYQMDPPRLVPSKETSDRWKNSKGDPMPLPLDSWPPSGSKRPDVVVARDKSKPPEPGNIEAIYEFKFKGDSWRKGQRDAYKEIARKDKAEVIEIKPNDPKDPNSCPACSGFNLTDEFTEWAKKLLQDLVEDYLKEVGKDWVRQKLLEGLGLLGILWILLHSGPADADEEDPSDKDHTDPEDHDDPGPSPDPVEPQDPPFHNEHDPPILPVVWPPPPVQPTPPPRPRRPAPIQILWPSPPARPALPHVVPSLPRSPAMPEPCDWPHNRGVFR